MEIGVGQVDYTPEPGLPLLGNYRDDYAARGVHDPLEARALVFSDARGEKVALLSMDICMLDRENVRVIREFAAARTSIAPENILVAATHTHSGPAALAKGMWPPAASHEVEAFLQKAAEAIVAAEKNLTPGALALGRGSEDRLSFNRRLKCRDGLTHMNWEGLDPDFVLEPWGPIDPEVLTLSITREGRTAAVLVNFGLHPAVLAGDNWLYSADYPGYLAEALQRLVGAGCTALFFNGCCGNVNHIDYRDPLQGRGYQMTQRIGYMLAVAAFRTLGGATPVRGERIGISRRQVKLQPLSVTEERRQWAEKTIAEARDNPAPGRVDGQPDEYYARVALEMYERQHRQHTAEVMAIRLGDAAIVGLPGELFCELGMEIKRRSPTPGTLVFELANDAMGYFPTPEAFEQGGYEPTPGTTYYTPEAGRTLAAAALDQLETLFA